MRTRAPGCCFCRDIDGADCLIGWLRVREGKREGEGVKEKPNGESAGRRKKKGKEEKNAGKKKSREKKKPTLEVLAVPLLEGLQQLQPVGARVHGHRGRVGRRRRGLVRVHPGVEALGRELVADGRRERNLLAVGADERVDLGVEREVPGDGVGGDELRGGDEGVRGRVAVVAGGEVAVVGGDDGVGDAY